MSSQKPNIDEEERPVPDGFEDDWTEYSGSVGPKGTGWILQTQLASQMGISTDKMSKRARRLEAIGVWERWVAPNKRVWIRRVRKMMMNEEAEERASL